MALAFDLKFGAVGSCAVTGFVFDFVWAFEALLSKSFDAKQCEACEDKKFHESFNEFRRGLSTFVSIVVQ